MTLRSAFLWIHVLGGALWIGGSACFALAAAALESDSKERREFAIGAAVPINRLNLGVAIVVLISGIMNLWFVDHLRHFALPRAFTYVLAGKLLLYVLMVVTLGGALGVEGALKRAHAGGDFTTVAAKTGRLVTFYLLTVIMGALALGLGLWLAGT